MAASRLASRHRAEHSPAITIRTRRAQRRPVAASPDLPAGPRRRHSQRGRARHTDLKGQEQDSAAFTKAATAPVRALDPCPGPSSRSGNERQDEYGQFGAIGASSHSAAREAPSLRKCLGGESARPPRAWLMSLFTAAWPPFSAATSRACSRPAVRMRDQTGSSMTAGRSTQTSTAPRHLWQPPRLDNHTGSWTGCSLGRRAWSCRSRSHLIPRPGAGLPSASGRCTGAEFPLGWHPV